MSSTRARVVLCLAVFAALAAVTAGLVDQPQFDMISGPDWAERAAALEPAGVADRSARLTDASPAIASGLILLAAGLIVTVLAFAAPARRLVGTR